MACICSLQNKKDAAFEHLDLAIKAGFSNLGQLAADADFANIRQDKRFKKFIPKILPDKEIFAEPTRIIHKISGEASGDQFGWTARRVGDWDKDGVIDFVATAPTHAGAGNVYVYSSRRGKLLLEKKGRPGEQFGNSATGTGDVNHDGVLDLVVGAPNGKVAGNAYVYSGKNGELLHHFKGATAGDKFGYEVSELGDVGGTRPAASSYWQATRPTPSRSNNARIDNESSLTLRVRCEFVIRHIQGRTVEVQRYEVFAWLQIMKHMDVRVFHHADAALLKLARIHKFDGPGAKLFIASLGRCPIDDANST